MSKVLEMERFRRKKTESVFTCACGGQHFYLHKDGTIECRSCKHIVETIEWMYRAEHK